MPTEKYEKFRERIDKAKSTWRLRRLMRKIRDSGLKNSEIGGLESTCQAKILSNQRKNTKCWDWLQRWSWQVIAGIIVGIVVGLVLLYVKK